MRQRLVSSLNPANIGAQTKSLRFSNAVQLHILELSNALSHNGPRASSSQARLLTTSRALRVATGAQNRVQPSVRRPADFHTLLQTSSSTNTLLLALFKTSTCQSCDTITPLLESIVRDRPQPCLDDKYSSIAFAELELDSPERDDGGGRGWTTMYDIGIEYGVRSVPTLIGFGGRRADRVTDRVADEKLLKDKEYMQAWIDESMKKGDPNPSSGRGLFARLFGGS